MKPMFLTLVILSCFASACSPKGSSDNSYGGSVQPNMGGTTAGGGGLLNSVKLEMPAARKAVEESRQLILFYLYRYEKPFTTGWSYCDDPKQTDPKDVQWCSAGKKIFSNGIFSALKNVRIHFEETQPCFTDAGEAVDGSVDHVPKGHICISGKNITDKLDAAVPYEPQIAGLVLHEISHLVGASQEEAIALQAALVKTLNKTSASTAREQAVSFRAGVYPLRGAMDLLIEGAARPLDFLSVVCTMENFAGQASHSLYAPNRDSQLQYGSDGLMTATVPVLYQTVAIADFLCKQSVAAANRAGDLAVLAKYKSSIERSSKRHAALNEKGSMPVLELFPEYDPSKITDLYTALLRAKGLKITATLTSVGEADALQRIVQLRDEVLTMVGQYLDAIEGNFSFAN